MIRGGIVGGYYGQGENPVSFIYLKGRTATGNPAGSTIGMLTDQSDRFTGGRHPSSLRHSWTGVRRRAL